MLKDIDNKNIEDGDIDEASVIDVSIQETHQESRTPPKKNCVEPKKTNTHTKTVKSANDVERRNPNKRNLKKAFIYTIIALSSFGVVRWLESLPDGGRDDDGIKINVDGNIAGHDYVDLGLPSRTLWATENINENDSIIEEESMYFEWGKIEPKHSEYVTTDTIYPNEPLLKGISGTSQDVATQLWGNDWMLPTEDDFVELERYCEMKWDEVHNGMYYTGPNGKTMFMPAYGLKSNADGNIEDNGRAGYYMMGKRNSPPVIEEEGMVFYIANPNDLGVIVTTITDGLTVRPVSHKKK